MPVLAHSPRFAGLTAVVFSFPSGFGREAFSGAGKLRLTGGLLSRVFFRFREFSEGERCGASSDSQHGELYHGIREDALPPCPCPPVALAIHKFSIMKTLKGSLLVF